MWLNHAKLVNKWNLFIQIHKDFNVHDNSLETNSNGIEHYLYIGASYRPASQRVRPIGPRLNGMRLNGRKSAVPTS